MNERLEFVLDVFWRWLVHACIVGTHTDNMRDAARKGRLRGFSDQRGTRNFASKLTEESVLELRALYETGNWTFTELAERYGVTSTTILLAAKRRTWTHL